MGGLTIFLLCLLLAMGVGIGVRYALQCHRLHQLTESLEDFLSCQGKPLDFSVEEDGFSPLHNAVAELENRLLLAKEQQAEECNRTSQLTADISHQLKTPLASLRLFCEMDAGPHLEQEISQIERMERLIHSLLRLERLCADGYAFHFATHDIGQLVGDLWSSLQEVYPARTLRVEGQAAIRCDGQWMREAFLNLLKNACEHTPPGGVITLQMECTEASFYCTVTDTGGGVPPQALPRLFTRFYRAPGQESTGAGLGLAIVREIVRRHHGEVHGENTESGLRVCISLPLLPLTKS